jgi:hypothetical protein
MKDLLDKLSSYNLFNYLLPGVLFSVLGEYLTAFTFLHDNIVIGVFIYYFIGLIVSRLGSLVLEPLLKKMSFISFAPYADYIAASKKDSTIEVLSEANNTYRTLCALFMALSLLALYDHVTLQCPAVVPLTPYILLALLLILFLFAYRKQTDYVRKRVLRLTDSASQEQRQ